MGREVDDAKIGRQFRETMRESYEAQKKFREQLRADPELARRVNEIGCILPEIEDDVTVYKIETTDKLEHEQHLKGLDALLALWNVKEYVRRVWRGKEEGDVDSILDKINAELEDHGLDLDRLVP